MRKLKPLLKNISPLNDQTEMPVILYVIKVIIIFWVVKYAAELIGEGIVIAFLFACGKNPLQGEMFDPGIMTLIMYFGYGILIGIVILYWKLFQKKTVSELGFTKNMGTYLIGAATGAILVTISTLLIVSTGAITYHGVFDRIDHTMILLMLGGFIFQGAMEEVLCRGIVLQLLKGRVPISLAIGINTVLFIAPHLSNMGGVSAGIVVFALIDLVLISVLFSLLTLRYQTLWVACGAHSLWNFILYNILGLNLSGKDDVTAAVFEMRTVGSNLLNGGIYGIEASAVTAIVLAAAVILMIGINRKGRAADGIQ